MARPILLLAFLLILAAPAAAHDDAFPFDGVLSGLVDEALGPDEEAASTARDALVDLGTKAAPYLLVARSNLAEGEKLDPVIDEILRAVTGPDAPFRGALEVPATDGEVFDLWRAGIRRKATAVLLAARPVSLRAARIHLERDAIGPAVRTLRALAGRSPERIPEILEIDELRTEDHDALVLLIHDLLDDGAAFFRGRSDEEKARFAYATASWQRRGRRAAYESIAKVYPDTRAGLLARYASIGRSDGKLEDRVPRMKEFVEAHPGTEAAAAALANLAFHHSNTNLSKAGEDPIGRLRYLAEIAGRLREEGSFDEALTVDGYLGTFRIYKPKFADGSRDELRRALRLYFAHHLLTDEHAPGMDSYGYLVRSRFEKLHLADGAEKDDLPEKLDEELAAIEEIAPFADHVSYFRAMLSVRAEDYDRAETALQGLAGGEGIYGRKAEAALATLLFELGDNADAQKLYAEYVEQYPSSPYSFIAALRVGLCDAREGHWDHAIAAFRAARNAYPDHAVLVPLAHAFLGRAQERKGRFDDAIFEYEKALAAWDTDFDEELHARPDRSAEDEVFEADVTQAWLRGRIETLGRTDVAPEHRVRFEQAQRLIERGRHEGALRLLEMLLAESPGPGPALTEEIRTATADLHLSRALAAADRSKEDADDATAFAELAKAESGGAFHRLAAPLTRAALLIRDAKRAEDAKAVLAEALEEWSEGQKLTPGKTALEQEIAAIREAAFKPYMKDYRRGHWKPKAPYPYLVLPTVMVVGFPDGSQRLVKTQGDMDLESKLLYLDPDQLAWISHMIDTVGGPYAVPRPPGDARAIAKLLSGFFPVFGGHWGGWHVASYPLLYSVRFENDHRKIAKLGFRVGYSGGDVLMSRDGDAWSIDDVDFQWIE